MRLPNCQITTPTERTSLRVLGLPMLTICLLTCLRRDLTELRRWLRERGYSGAYALVGMRDGIPHVRVGEGDCLWDRLRTHELDPELVFADTIFVLTAPHWGKSDVLFFQEHLSDRVQPPARLVAGVGAPRRRPSRSELYTELEVGLSLLRLSGCQLFEPNEEVAMSV